MFISCSLASLTPVSSVTIPSTTLACSNTDEGSWQITKTASWLSKGKARINIKLNTVEKLKNDYTDVILVLDTSGSMLGDTVLTGIKNITDNQFIANTSNLKKFLYKASVGTANYEKLILTDYVDTNYFNLDNVTDITTSSGSASINNNKVTWNLDNLKSGTEAELTIDINLNSDLIGKGGIYPTHTETDVYYKIGNTSVTYTSTKTTVLKDNYTVNYDMNTPVECTVSNVPSSKIYSVLIQ